MADGIDVTIKGLDKTIRRNQSMYDIVQTPKMAPIVSAIAVVWDTNFRTEGSLVGGWRPLTEQTNALRVSRGYPPVSPILVQSGDLKRAAVDSLIGKGEYNESVTGDGVLMTYVASERSFKLNISGKKVTNQFRSQSRKRGSANYSAPPRRFWFVSPAVTDAAKNALLKGIKERLSRV